jgi:glyoxylase-like metal-dependent hydrolase (beta-lactamase superfamily II)
VPCRRGEDRHVRAPEPIAFNLTYDEEPGRPWRCSDLVRCVVAPNPGPFTFTGTNTYLIGERRLAVVDPGPDDDKHLATLVDAIGDAEVTHILVTHTHRDHSPLVPKLAALTGANVVAFGMHPRARFVVPDAKGEGGDVGFRPDTAIGDGYVVRGEGWTMRAVHTPGHIANHLCFALDEQDVLFTGDHIMGWSTSVISPIDGDLGDFYASAQRLIDRHETRYYSAHGAPIDDPRALVAAIVEHRQFRDAQVLDQLGSGNGELDVMVERIYPGLDERLVKAANGTLLSHLLRLIDLGAVEALDAVFADGVAVDGVAVDGERPAAPTRFRLR